ncbi:hypothetical protein KO481_35625 [Nocardia sp. NEAU-G5]|uniref:Uncharacterized protein n=1 Tax=Nocardia albiluteola TaxID=2842303 RepID=A0ABS6B957_9NOCA|nr:hypothetical protein [Nocardia albiluteola]MBU3066837.1 hypothetical protein [Nocardia albiluteola]
MTIPHLICQFCAHHNNAAQSQCAHCGGPLAAKAGKLVSGAEAGKLVTAAEEIAMPLVAKALPAAGKALPGLLDKFRGAMQWQAVVAALGILGLLAVAALHSCTASPLLGRSAPTSAEQALPDTLRTESSCTPFDTAKKVDKCVVAANEPLLSGLTAGQALSYYLQTDTPDQLTATIARWRATGGTILADGPRFVAINPSDSVWFADRQSGLHLETGNFADRVAAQTFLLRSGLD